MSRSPRHISIPEGSVSQHPIRILVSDDLRRSLLTVFFRILLALPHIVWLTLWGVVAYLAAILNWIVTLIRGRSPDWLHRFLARYVRYWVHVEAYLYLAANPFPGFLGAPGYPVDVEIEGAARQNRWTVGFRLILAIPALVLAGALVESRSTVGYSLSLLSAAALLAWFASLVRGRTSRGLRDTQAWALCYGAQLHGYLLLLTDRYPNSDPYAALPNVPARTEAVAIEVDDDLRRSRLTVFFRLLLALPHILWLALWGILAWLAAIVNWVATLIAGSSPDALHRFLAAFIRYATHVYAYLYLVANPFPGFTGRGGSYPIDLRIAPSARQNRWTVLFRGVLAIPALLLVSAFGSLAASVALLGWFAALFTARMPLGLRNAGAQALRYGGQVGGYLMVLGDAYPYSGPSTAPAPAVSLPENPLSAPPLD